MSFSICSTIKYTKDAEMSLSYSTVKNTYIFLFSSKTLLLGIYNQTKKNANEGLLSMWMYMIVVNVNNCCECK